MYKTAVYTRVINGEMHKVTRLKQQKIMNGDITSAACRQCQSAAQGDILSLSFLL